MVHILLARENGVFHKQCRGWFDVNGTYRFESVEEHLRTCGDGKFHIFPFFKILQENKSLKKSYEDYFIDKFKPLLNKKT